MKLIKNTVAFAIFSIFSIFSILAQPVMAESVDIYGRADVSLQLSDNGDGKGSFTELNSNASRIGFKGTHELNDGLTVIYQAEFQVDIDGDADDVFTGRNQFIGLKGSFGEVLLGKNDTILKQSQGKVDLFSDLNGDIKVLWKGENRMSDTITYKSPKFNGIQLGATYVAEGKSEGEDALSIAAFYGDKSLKKSGFFASVALDADVKGYDALRATIQGKLAGVVLGFMLQNQENTTTGAEMDGVMFSAKYKIGETTLKGQYQVADHKGGEKNTGITAGVDYKLAASTKLYAFYTTFDMKTNNTDEDYLAAGIQYNF